MHQLLLHRVLRSWWTHHLTTGALLELLGEDIYAHSATLLAGIWFQSLLHVLLLVGEHSTLAVATDAHLLLRSRSLLVRRCGLHIATAHRQLSLQHHLLLLLLLLLLLFVPYLLLYR